MDLTSQAFPPDFSHDNHQFSRVHEFLKESNQDLILDNVYYRPIKHSHEVEELNLLYKEWFPLEYPEEFYEGLLDHPTIKILVAFYDLEHQGKKKTIILGSVIYEPRQLDLSFVGYPLLHFLKKYSGIYILSIGVIDELRQKGLATVLMSKLLDIAKEDKSVKYLYLDVIEYNKSAIRFYEKIGFQKVMTRDSYYEIFDIDQA